MGTTSGGVAPGHAAQLHAALSVLAGLSEGVDLARADRLRGSDTVLGYALAAMPPDRWDDDAARQARDLLSRYREQLVRAGVDVDPTAAPASSSPPTTDDPPPARRRFAVRCAGRSEPVVLSLPDGAALLNAARAIDGREYHAETRTHRFPFTSLPAVVELAGAHGLSVSPRAHALVPLARAVAARRIAVEAAGPEVYLDNTAGIVFEAPYAAELDAALRALNHGQPAWDAAVGVYRAPLHTDPTALLEIAVAHGLKVAPAVHAAIDVELSRQVRNTAESSAITAPPVDIPGLAPGRSLKSQQFPVVRFALRNRRVIIGDNMGWGKTLSSLAACAVNAVFPVVIVCRPSLTLNWAKEIATFFPGWRVHVAGGSVPSPVPPDTHAVIIGSAALATYIGSDEQKAFPWVAQLASLNPGALVVDEGQDAKESAANRSQAIEHLASVVLEQDGLVLDLSGTPLVNRPKELCQQLVFLGRIEEFGGAKAYLARYCGGKGNAGRQNLDELHDRLIAWGVMVRRTDDAALGLPALRQHALIIPEAALDPDAMARYHEAEADIVSFLADRAAAIAAELGENPNSARVRAAMAALSAEHLVRLNTLRVLIGEAKLPAITRWVGEQLRHGNKVMIAAHHRKVVGAFAREFGGLVIKGGQSVEDKERDKARFQTLDLQHAPVIVVAITAGGVGHTLTAAHVGVQAEYPWTPGDSMQMMKRLHRIGQRLVVDYYRAIARGTIDSDMVEVLADKQATLDQVLDGQRPAGMDEDDRSVAAEVAWILTQRGLARRNGE